MRVQLQHNGHAVETTRGLPFDPSAARRRHEVEHQIRQAQIDAAYREHTTGQARFRRAQRRAS